MSPTPVLVIGAGPAGLRAAEVISAAGAPVTLLDASPWPGRKLLVAGRSGLNLTHGEDPALFATRFLGGEARWPDLLADLGPAEVRAWAAGLGIETYVGSSRRIFPVGDKASGLLRAWLRRLGEAGVELRSRHRFLAFEGQRGVRVEGPEGPALLEPAATVLALGGGSWPRTGSDGGWVSPFRQAGIEVAELQPSNCGYRVDWPPGFLEKAEGLPLKNLALSFGELRVQGELMVTRYGLEGGALYRLSAALRGHTPATVHLDLKPQVPEERLLARLQAFRGKGSLRRRAGLAWKLGPAGKALLASTDEAPAEELAARVKALPLCLLEPRPLAEAISSAGGVRWSQLDEQLMLRARPGTFVAGEMIDWDAPTGGYLLTGCLATGERAGRGALRYLGLGPGGLSPPAGTS